MRRALALFAAALLGPVLAAPPPGRAAAPPSVDAAQLERIMPGADAIGAFRGEPPAAPVRRAGRLVGYAFFSRQVIASTGYSGKPLDVLVGLGLDGRITGARIVEHHEPILAIGVSDDDLSRFVDQHRGLDIRRPVRVARAAAPDRDVIATISGASVSAIVISDTILRSARIVARQRGILDEAPLSAAFDRFEPATWPDLLADGSIVRLRVAVDEITREFARRGSRYFPADTPAPDGQETFVELYAGLATIARTGRNLLGDRDYNRILSQAATGDHIIFVAARGLYSFRGTAWRRAGSFDRIQLTQNDRTVVFARADHVRIDRLGIEGAPELREMSVFIARRQTGFRAEEPWQLDVFVKPLQPAAAMLPVVRSLSWRLPDRYRASGRGSAGRGEAALWAPIWLDRAIDIAVLCVALAGLTAILFFQNALVRNRRAFLVVRTAFLLFTLVWIGWYAAAQLNVLNVLVFVEAVRTEFHWERFMLDPLVFILWGFVALTLLFWGRGVFCGWLCPFGALQDLLNRIAQGLRLPQITVPFGLHERMWPLKYVIFIGLFGLSLGAIAGLPLAVEVEPFKTAIVMRFARAWPFVAYAGGLLAVGLFINRFFCRYVCPLGGALAFPSRLRMFDWLRRRWQCGIQCQICANQCPVQAIHPSGQINPNECIHCLHCQMLYDDDTTCPPLVERRRRSDPQMTDRLIRRLSEAETKGEAARNGGNGSQ